MKQIPFQEFSVGTVKPSQVLCPTGRACRLLSNLEGGLSETATRMLVWLQFHHPPLRLLNRRKTFLNNRNVFCLSPLPFYLLWSVFTVLAHCVVL